MKLAGNRLRFGAAALLTMAGVALAVPNLASADNSALRPTGDDGVGISSDNDNHPCSPRAQGDIQAGEATSVGGVVWIKSGSAGENHGHYSFGYQDAGYVIPAQIDVGDKMKNTSHADVCGAPSKEVTPIPPTLNPPTCVAGGSLVIPAQPAGVSITPGVGTHTAPADYEVVVTPLGGYVFPDGFDTNFDSPYHVLPATGYQSNDPQSPCHRPPDDFDKRIDEGVCDGPGDGSATRTVFYTDFTYVLDSNSQWVRTQDGDEYVVSTLERALTEKELENCRPENPPSDEITEDTGSAECGDTTLETRTTVTHYTYEYNAATLTWDKVLAGTAEISFGERELTDEEVAALTDQCVTNPGEPTQSDPCGPGNAAWDVPSDTETIDWELVNGGLVATAVGGYKFGNGETAINYGLPAESGEECPAPNAEVVCTSTGPDYVSWQLTNTGEVAIVSPVALAPGESAVIESLRGEEGSVTVAVLFADQSPSEFVGSGDGCVFTPPVTTQPPDTTAPPTETTQPPVTTNPTTPTEPPTTPGPSGLSISAIGPVCLRDAPYIEVTFGNQPEFNGRPAAITFIDLDGSSVGTDTATYQAGSTVRFVYPGASVDGAGNPTDWPGWMLVDGHWVVDPSDARLRDGLTVVIEVNPTATATVSYPPATAACANPQTTPDPAPSTTVPAPAGRLPQTGASTGVLAMVAAAFLLAGGGAIFATRRSGANG